MHEHRIAAQRIVVSFQRRTACVVLTRGSGELLCFLPSRSRSRARRTVAVPRETDAHTPEKVKSLPANAKVGIVCTHTPRAEPSRCLPARSCPIPRADAHAHASRPLDRFPQDVQQSLLCRARLSPEVRLVLPA